ncbi:MAG: hypothetical protein OCC49_19035 [Fibrobacterales bacterium]
MSDEDIPEGAIIQRDKKTYAIVPKTPVGLITVEDLDNISYVAKKYSIPILKITSGQRIALVGVEKEDVAPIWKDLKMDPGQAKGSELCLHYVQACPGTAVCKYGVQDSIGLGTEIEQVFSDISLAAKVKIGVSGCPFCCGESFVRDIGLLGKKNGWSLIIGGSSARRPRIGDIVAEKLTKEEVITLTNKFLLYYSEHAKRKERTARFCDRIGIEKVKEAILGEDY